MFGYADRPGMTVGCVNPALPGSKDWMKLDSYWFARSSYPVAGGPITWSSEGPPPTPYLRTEGLVSAKCINDGQRGFLSVHTNADPDASAPTASAAKSASWACSCPAGACTLPISPWHKATLSDRSARSALDPEQLLDRLPERLGHLQGEQRRRSEHAVFDGVDGLAADADPRGELGLGPALGLPRLSQAIDQRSANPVRPPFADARS